MLSPVNSSIENQIAPDQIAQDGSSEAAHLEPADITTNLFSIFFMALAGPATVILWTEPDPRDSGELSLVEAPTT